MRTSKITSLKLCNFLVTISFLSFGFLISSCGGDGERSCEPKWASWDVTFNEGADKSSQKNAFEETIKGFVNNTDSLGNTCTVKEMIWTDKDERNSTLNVCIECKDSEGKAITDTTAPRPPGSVKPPASLTVKLIP